MNGQNITLSHIKSNILRGRRPCNGNDRSTLFYSLLNNGNNYFSGWFAWLLLREVVTNVLGGWDAAVLPPLLY